MQKYNIKSDVAPVSVTNNYFPKPLMPNQVSNYGDEKK